MEPDLPTWIEKFSTTAVLVVGDVMLDEYIWGEVRRISPEAPVPVVEVRNRTCTPGGAANPAANIASLGGVAYLGGVTGCDAAGEELRRCIAAMRLPVDGLIEDAQRPTTKKSRIVAHNQQVVRLDVEVRRPIPAEAEERLLAWVRTQLPKADACLISDYAKGVVTNRVAESVIAIARSQGRPVVVDPKQRSLTRFRGATVITPNVHEAEHALHREIRSEEDVHEAGRLLMAAVEGSVLITRGAEGMTLFRPDAAPLHVPAEARRVYDVTGAGDTVAAVLALALGAGVPLEWATRLANSAAGIVVGKLGTATVTVEEILRTL
jgi:D-beta-D-heptose 7-phosphate kinase/D-beta-D-heptose 1-phosphate adenosyltransferase